MISIIILTHNQHDVTEECIASIRRNTTDLYELIIIDNGSNPPFIPDMDVSEGKAYRNHINLGYPVGVNRGLQIAEGDTIVLLNNDVIVSHQWSSRMRYHFNEFDIIGTTTNYVAGYQKRTIDFYQDVDQFELMADAFYDKHRLTSTEVTFVMGLCMMFKKDLVDKIGNFDESLWPCSGEDIDFCLRARSKGYKVGIADDVYVHHFGSKTLNAMQEKGELNYLELCNRNDDHLAKRWGRDFWQNQKV